MTKKQTVQFNRCRREIGTFIATQFVVDPKLEVPTVATALLHVLLTVANEGFHRNKDKALAWLSDAINQWPCWNDDKK